MFSRNDEATRYARARINPAQPGSDHQLQRAHLFNGYGNSRALVEFSSLDEMLCEVRFPRAHLRISAETMRGRTHVTLSSSSQLFGRRALMRGEVFDSRIPSAFEAKC